MRGDDERLHEINEAWGIGFVQQTFQVLSGVPNHTAYRREQYVRGRQWAHHLNLDSDCQTLPDSAAAEATPL